MAHLDAAGLAGLGRQPSAPPDLDTLAERVARGTRSQIEDVEQAGIHVHVALGAPAGQVIVYVEGELDRCTMPRLTAAFTAVLATAGVTEVQVDLAAVTFVDVAGARCLLACRREAAEAAIPMPLRAPARPVTLVLKALHLLDGFDVDLVSADDAVEYDEQDQRRQWVARVRRQARQTRARAREAVERSQRICPPDR